MTHIYVKQSKSPHNSALISASVRGIFWRAVMERKILVFSLFFILITLPIVYLVFKYQSKAEAAWFDDSFAYRQTVAITNAGTAQTDFQVAITLNTSALVTAGKMQSDCDDIRITDVNGKILPHWTEKLSSSACNTATTKIWTKVPSISTTGTTLYLYYGNPTAATVENGNNTFIFFDDFSTSSLDTKKWTEDAVNNITDSITSGKLRVTSCTQDATSNYWIYNNTDTGSQHQAKYGDTDNVIIDWDSTLSDTSDTQLGQAGLALTTADNYVRAYLNHSDWSGGSAPARYWHYEATAGNEVAGATETVGFSLKRSGSNTYYLVNGTQKATGTLTSSPNKIVIACGIYTSTYPYLNYVELDNIRTRKYASTEPSVASPTNEEKSAGPVAYWKFDEGYGTAIKDSTQNANNSTSFSATWTTEDQCISGKCLSLNGTSNNISITDSPSLSPTSAVTMEAWINLNASPGDTGKSTPFFTVAQKDGGYSGMGVYGLRINTTRTVSANLSHGVGVSENKTVTTTDVLDKNKWYHLAFTYNQTSAEIKIYINGKLVKTDNTYSQLLLDSSSVFRIGIGDGRYFSGLTDDVKIYPYARTAAQIKTDFASKGSGSVKGTAASLGSSAKNSDAFSNGLVGYWKMDEASWTNDCTATSVTDSSGNANNGKSCPASTGPTGGAAGKFGNGGSFDGSDDSINLSSSVNLSGEFTITMWFNKTDSLALRTLISKNLSGGPKIFFDTSNQLGVRAVSTIGYQNIGYSSSMDGSWHHLVVTRDSSNNIKAYLDGGNPTTFYTESGTSTWEAIGRTPPDNQNWYGKIDETRIYNRALSGKEVRDLYAWAPGPVGYWNFDEKTGTTLSDSSGNGNTSSAFSGNTSWTNGKFGGGLSFDGTDDLVRIPETSYTDLGLITDSYTIEAWFKTSSNFSTAATLVSKDDGSGTYPFRLYLDGSEYGCFFIYDGSALPTVCGSTALNNGVWHHIAGTRDVLNDKIYLYIDGVLINSTTDTTTASGANDDNLVIANSGNSYTQFDFAGSIDEVKVYRYARTQKQIVEDMNAGHPAPGSPVGSAVGYWKMDEGYGDTANNSGSGGSTINGDLAGSGGSCPGGAACPTWNQNGKFGKALSFDGSNDYVDISSSNFDFAGKDFTISLWTYYYGYISHGSAWNCFIGRDDAFSTTGYGICTSSNNQVQFSAGNVQVNSGVNITTGWHHIVAVHDSITPQLRIYVDGVLKNTATYANQLTSKITALTAIGEDNQGARQANSITDEVKIYSAALTADEIKLDYNRGSAMVLGESVENRDRVTSGQTLYLDATNKNSYPGSGTNWYDLSGNNYNATLSSPTWNGLKFTNTAATLTGLGSSVYPNIATNTTILWVYPEIGGGSVWSVTDMDAHTYMSYLSTAYINTWETGTYNQRTTWDVTESVPHQIVITKNGSVRTVYDNMVQKGQVTITNIATSVNSNLVYGVAAQPMGLSIVETYNRVLSADEITQDYYAHAYKFNINAGPIGEWNFEEGTGISANDTSGNGYTGTITGATWTNGKVGKALNFSATNDKVQTSNAILTGTGDFSIEAWINPTNTAIGYIAGNYGGGSCSTGIEYLVHANLLKTYIGGYANSTTSISAGNWYHVATTRLGGSVKQYINGRLDTTTNLANSIGGNCNWSIGNGPNYTSERFQGKIDSARVFNYARTPAQVAYDYNRGGPVGWWKMDECQGVVAYDSAAALGGAGNNGTITIGATVPQSSPGTCTDGLSTSAWYNGRVGKYNSSLNFDGVDDYVSSSYVPGIGSNMLTITAWIKPTDVSGTEEISNQSQWDGGPWTGWRLQKVGSSIYFKLGDNTSTTYSYSAGTLTAGQWQYVAGVWDGSYIRIYIDGKEVGNAAKSFVYVGNTNPHYIGKYAGAAYYYNGQIDDVKIFNYALTGTQVKTLFNENSAIRFGPSSGSP